MVYQYRSITTYTDDDYDLLLSKLPSNDQTKMSLLVKNSHRHQRILGRVLLKEILKNNYNLNYDSLIIKYNSFGKPYADGINFNISHSHDYVIVALASSAVGVDIEKVRNINLSTMNIFCTDNEIKYINNCHDKYLAFWKIFTLKEAYFKMLGTDLSNMKKIEFNILRDKVVCLNKPNLKILISTEINGYVFAIIY